MYTGLANEEYKPHGKGLMVYDTGEIMKGYWVEGEFLREIGPYSDSENDEDDDDDADEDGDEDLSSSMANIAARSRDRSRSRSRSKERFCPDPLPHPPSPPKAASPSPPPPEYKIGDTGKRRDMITDKDEASLIIEQLRFGDGA